MKKPQPFTLIAGYALTASTVTAKTRAPSGRTAATRAAHRQPAPSRARSASPTPGPERPTRRSIRSRDLGTPPAATPERSSLKLLRPSYLILAICLYELAATLARQLLEIDLGQVCGSCCRRTD